jgi:hypothetical protein
MQIIHGTRRCLMQKVYVVRLNDEERVILRDVIGKLKGSSTKFGVPGFSSKPMLMGRT